MTPFAVNLKAALESTPDLSRRGRKMLDLLNSRDSRRKTLVLASMELHSIVALDIHDNDADLDWASIFSKIKIVWGLLKLLLAILPYLKQEEGME